MKHRTYYVSYMTMDTDAGANPFWHASLILSTQDTESSPIRVIDAVGFYSQPSSTTDPLIAGLKHMLGFKIDLQDGHGILKKEKMRDLDGNGLHAIHFEATKTQFNNLQELYTKKMRLEHEAIAELNHQLHARGEPQNGHTRYVAERSLATLNARETRLQPFHIQMNLTKKGFDSSTSYGCKNYALDMLLEVGIIDKPLHDKIIGGPFKSAFPRFSGIPSEPVKLVSTGEPQQDISTHSRKVYYNRHWDKNQLFWATGVKPLNMQKKESIPSSAQLATNEEVYPIIKDILNRIRLVESELRHKITELDDTRLAKRHDELKEQLDRVMTLYGLFRVSYENQLKPCLTAKLLQAETTLDIANLSLTPNKIDHSFLLRAYTSIATRHAMLGLIGMLIAATCLSGALGAAMVTTAALYSTHQLFSFFKEDSHFSAMRTHYLAFKQAKRTSNNGPHDHTTQSPAHAIPV